MSMFRKLFFFNDPAASEIYALSLHDALPIFLAAIAIPLYANVQQRARIAKAQADARALASAASIYGAHMGVVPTALTQLTSQVTNGQGQVAGPFMASVPPPPSGWAAYSYTANTATGVFTISSSGDATTVSLPSRRSAPSARRRL